jgi:flagellar biosynthesis/type III secretory pathway M-ring protein FliF/YscJ
MSNFQIPNTPPPPPVGGGGASSTLVQVNMFNLGVTVSLLFAICTVAYLMYRQLLRNISRRRQHIVVEEIIEEEDDDNDDVEVEEEEVRKVISKPKAKTRRVVRKIVNE